MLEPIDEAALHAAMFGESLDALLVVDEHGIVVTANRAVEGLLGVPREQLIGQKVETLVPMRYRQHAADRERYVRNPAPRGMGHGVSLFARHANGHDIPVDISLNPIVVSGRHLVAAAVRDLRGRSYVPDAIRVQATALRSAANGVVITDQTGIIIWVNPAVCRMTGYEAAELVGQHTRLLKSGGHPPAFYADIWATITRGETWSGTIVNKRKDGSFYYEEQTIAPVVDEGGSVTHFVAIKQDVTRQHELQEALTAANAALAASLKEIAGLNERLRDEALRDPLTGLHNRRFFDETADGHLARTLRNRQPFSIAVLDLDYFKNVNDEHGHGAGDAVLQSFAAMLRRCTRASDLVCRLGGEEFLVGMPGANAESARHRAEAWRSEFETALMKTAGGNVLACTVSVGVAEHRPNEETLEQTIARADEALYAAKQAGRNRVAVAT